jgi:hypothetical protein
MRVDLVAERQRSRERQAEQLVALRPRLVLRQARPGATRAELEEVTAQLYGHLPLLERSSIQLDAERIQTEERGRHVDPAELNPSPAQPPVTTEEVYPMAGPRLTQEDRQRVHEFVEQSLRADRELSATTLAANVRSNLDIQLAAGTLDHYRKMALIRIQQTTDGGEAQGSAPVASESAAGDRIAVPEEKEHVNHPAHYGGADNPYEAIKVIEAWDLDFCLGNTVKYISRAGKKDPAVEVEDLRKARWYLDHRIERLTSTVEHS